MTSSSSATTSTLTVFSPNIDAAICIRKYKNPEAAEDNCGYPQVSNEGLVQKKAVDLSPTDRVVTAIWQADSQHPVIVRFDLPEGSVQTFSKIAVTVLTTTNGMAAKPHVSCSCLFEGSNKFEELTSTERDLLSPNKFCKHGVNDDALPSLANTRPLCFSIPERTRS